MTADPALPLTGERTLPGIRQENYWFRRHEAAYRWAAIAAEVVGGLVLDAGTGEGYGGQLLRDAGARTVAGIDLDLATLRHLAVAHPQVSPVRANLVDLPVRTGAADAVVSAQTVEHLWDQRRFVSECARVLRPGGRLVLTTPNRRTFPPGNLFHSRELDADELVELVRAHVDVVQLAGLHHGRRLADADARLGGLVRAQLRAPYDQWDDELARVVAATTADDFVVAEPQGSLDLLLLGVRA